LKKTKGCFNIGLILLAVLLPLLFQNNLYIINIIVLCGIYIIVAVGLNLLTGFTGQISMGHAAFYGLGAYTSALLAVNYGLPFWGGIVIAAIVTFVFGIVMGLPSVKLSDAYLALVTIGFSIIVRLVLVNWVPVTRGPSGVTGIPAPMIGNFVFQGVSYYYLVLAFCLLAILVSVRLINSRVGRAFIAIRENIVAAESMGINTYKYKLIAFAISAMFAGVAGVLYAHSISYISPDSFTFDQSVTFLTMIMIGGLGSISGGVVGALLLGILPEYLRSFGDYQMAIYGLMIILVLIFMPQGIVGGCKSIWAHVTAKREQFVKPIN
jgi:branched-chain amino acid transport system permease protein